MTVLKRVLTLLVIAFVLSAQSTNANPISTDNVTASIIAEHDSVAPGTSLWIALKLAVREGWHTYWRNPGDSGAATSITWTLPDGFSAGEILWPYPERQYVGPVANYGYHGTALHLVELKVDSTVAVDTPFKLRADANWLVCEEECIPEKARLDFKVNTALAPIVNSHHEAAFALTRASIPKKLDLKSGFQYGDTGDTIRFEFAPHPELIEASSIEYFPYDWGLTQAPAEQQLTQDAAFISIDTKKGDLSFDKAISGILVVQAADGSKASYELESQPGTLSIGAQINTTASKSLELSSALLFAFLGGIILNLMPCVFPVLFVKALNLVNHATDSSSTMRLHGLVYTAGVLASFLVLALILLSVKAAGEQIGWGFQLQSPLFVSLVAIVMFTLGLSLSGYLKIGTRFMGVGSELADQPAYTGSFFTGVLAVVVATPCTAPFMGPALGFAFTQSSIVSIAVLLALGFGLALPYLLISMLPALANYLPKPDLWMERLQQLLAFPMYATAAWLVWVVSQQAGSNAVFLLLLAFILVAFSIWLWQSTRNASRTWKLLGACGTISSIIVVATIVLFAIDTYTTSPSVVVDGGNKTSTGPSYQNFDEAELTRLRQDGRAVFVNMTAAWCITCLANERVALSSPKIKTFFEENDISYFKGDWTNQDENISKYLQQFGRNSVPLYVYYPKNSATPKVLPQILTVASLIQNIDEGDSTIGQL